MDHIEDPPFLFFETHASLTFYSLRRSAAPPLQSCFVYVVFLVPSEKELTPFCKLACREHRSDSQSRVRADQLKRYTDRAAVRVSCAVSTVEVRFSEVLTTPVLRSTPVCKSVYVAPVRGRSASIR